jgi:hypothetical protein
MAELREEIRKLRMEKEKQNSSEGSNSWSREAGNRTDRGEKAPLLRLGKFDGTEPLRSFLDQFERFCQQFHWDGNERAFQLQCQCLWSLRDNATAEDMIQALKSRYGDSHLIDQYRAQLHDRKRKDGESISDLCDDLSQLLVLGFPNADEETRNYIGKDVFFRAIEANANLQMWVRDREPRNLEDCRTLATKAEANASISNYKAFEIKENKFSKRVKNIEAEKTAEATVKCSSSKGAAFSERKEKAAAESEAADGGANCACRASVDVGIASQHDCSSCHAATAPGAILATAAAGIADECAGIHDIERLYDSDASSNSSNGRDQTIDNMLRLSTGWTY